MAYEWNSEMRPLFLTALTIILVMQFPARRSSARIQHGHSLLEVGHASRLNTPPKAPDEIKVVSFNIRWRGGDDLKKLAQLFKTDAELGGATILGLQEVDRNRKRTRNANTVKVLAEELGMYYAWAAPPGVPGEKEEETGVAILSSYPLSHVHRLVLPHAGPGGRRRAAVGATVTIGLQKLRVYSVHSENRISVTKKLQQYRAVLTAAQHFDKDSPTIVLGDLNTWEGDAVDKTTKLFAEASFDTPFNNSSTFRRQILFVPIEFKLDWMWFRNLTASSHGIDREVGLSDHWPLWAVVPLATARENTNAGTK